MANMFGKLGYEGNIKANPQEGPGEMALDFVGDNVTTHWNEEIFSKLRPRVADGSNYNPVENSIDNGGLCTPVKVGRK